MRRGWSRRRMNATGFAIWPGSGCATGRRANRFGFFGLIAWARGAAVNVRVYVRVVERPGQDRHRGGADVGAVDGAFVVAALASRESADHKPDDKQQRSNVHF